MADKNGYSTNNALGTLITIGGLATLVGGALAAWQISATWTEQNTNLLIMVCGISTAAAVGFASVAFFSFAYFRQLGKERDREWSPPPAGYRPIIDGQLVGPGGGRRLPGPPDPYYEPMPRIEAGEPGSFDEIAYHEDYAE